MIRIEVLSVDNSAIRARISHQGSVEYLCLNDIVKYLDRSEMIESGRVLKICKSVTRYPFKDGGRNRWAIKPYDIHYLINEVSGENGLIEDKCLRLQDWVNTLPMSMQSVKPVIFTYQDKFPITFKNECDKTYVNATQMAKSFDKQPSLWLSLAATQEFREALVRNGKSDSLDSQVISTRGRNGITWIEEGLAMEFARWLSPEFSEWCNSKIKELLTDGYATMQPRETREQLTPQSTNMSIPKTFDEALQLAANQARKLRESEHKVNFYDDFVEGRNNFKSSRIADELEISVVLLHRFLAEEGIVHFERKRKRWVVNGPYRPLQCDAPYLWQREDGKVYPFGTVKRWTQAGREYIIELWNEKSGM